MNDYQQAHYSALVLHNFEGCSSWPYMDTHKPNSLMTVGIGCATTLDEMLTLPFHLGLPTGPLATPQQIREHYARVAAMAPGQWYTRYRYDGCLRLPEDSIRALVQKRYDGYVPALHRIFPAFESLPVEAKTGLLDLIWGVGPHGLEGFHHLIASVNQTPPDLSAASRQCAEVGTAYSTRNVWRALLFTKAAQERTQS